MTYKKKGWHFTLGSGGDIDSDWRTTTTTNANAIGGDRRSSSVKYAGTLIFNKLLDKILLVQGRKAGKWGPPKGESNLNEPPMTTALRETFEETGLKLEIDDALKTKYGAPYAFYIADITFYIYILDESLTIHPQDTNEICGYKWFSVDFLKNLVKNTEYYDLYNSPIRSILDDRAKYNIENLLFFINTNVHAMRAH